MAHAENQVIFGKLSFSLLWVKPCCSGIHSIGEHTSQGKHKTQTYWKQGIMCSPKGWFSHKHIVLLQCPRAVRGQSPVLWSLDVGGGCEGRVWLSGLIIALLHSEGHPVRFPDISLGLSQFGSGCYDFDPLRSGIFAVLFYAEAWSTGGVCPCPGPMTRKASTSRGVEDMDWLIWFQSVLLAHTEGSSQLSEKSTWLENTETIKHLLLFTFAIGTIDLSSFWLPPLTLIPCSAHSQAQFRQGKQ